MLQYNVTATDNLLELGLNSILATQFAWQAAQFNIVVSAEQLFNFPSVDQLVAELSQSTQKEIEEELELLMIERADRVPLTYAERSLYLILLFHLFFELFQLFILNVIDISSRPLTAIPMRTMSHSCCA